MNKEIDIVKIKVLANKLLHHLSMKYPHKKHCAFIEENICDACDEKLEIVRFLLEYLTPPKRARLERSKRIKKER